MGPTASGKTALAVELVQRLPFEIVSVDSALVYREMDIGTAKPDAETRRIAPHRLVDILDPAEAYSAGQFRTDALREIAAIQAAGHVPAAGGRDDALFSGAGTGAGGTALRRSARPRPAGGGLAEQGSAALHARLARLDPAAAARIHPSRSATDSAGARSV